MKIVNNQRHVSTQINDYAIEEDDFYLRYEQQILCLTKAKEASETFAGEILKMSIEERHLSRTLIDNLHILIDSIEKENMQLRFTIAQLHKNELSMMNFIQNLYFYCKCIYFNCDYVYSIMRSIGRIMYNRMTTLLVIAFVLNIVILNNTRKIE